MYQAKKKCRSFTGNILAYSETLVGKDELVKSRGLVNFNSLHR